MSNNGLRPGETIDQWRWRTDNPPGVYPDGHELDNPDVRFITLTKVGFTGGETGWKASYSNKRPLAYEARGVHGTPYEALSNCIGEINKLGCKI